MKVKDTNLTKHQTAPDFMTSAQGLFRVCAFWTMVEMEIYFWRSENLKELVLPGPLTVHLLCKHNVATMSDMCLFSNNATSDRQQCAEINH